MAPVSIAIHVASLKMGGPTFSEKFYWQAYLDLLLRLRGRGVDAFFVTEESEYIGGGFFRRTYSMDRPGRPGELMERHYLRADLVYDRGGFSGTGVAVVNSPAFVELTNCKARVYEQFGHLQPFTELCHDRAQLELALRMTSSNLAVVKVPTGEGGEGVGIGSPEAILAKVLGWPYPLLVQEFMDTSIGVPELGVEGYHDLRVKIIDGRVVGGTIRQPKPGEYRANFKIGGKSTQLSRHDIPPAALELTKEVDSHFGDEPRHYALDCGNTTAGYQLIELNPWPGLAPSGFSPTSAYIMKELTASLVRQAFRAKESVILNLAPLAAV
jgi:hypothetical protein